MSLYLVFALSLFGFTSVTAGRVLLSLYALNLGAQPFAVGVLASTLYVFPMLLAWPVGTLADRFGSRWLLTCGAVCGVLGMVIPYFVRELPALYVAAAFLGLSFVSYNVPLQNLVGVLSAPQDRTRNFSNFSLVGAATNLLGPLLAGFSIDHSGHAVTCLYVAALPIAAAALLALWGGMLPGGTRRAAAAAGIRSTLAQPGVARMLATSSLVQVGIDLFQFYFPVYGHAIELSASAIGIVLATFAAASFVVRLVMLQLVARLGEERLLAYAFCLAAASVVLVPFFKSTVVLALISFVFGLGMGLGQPITVMLMFSCAAEGRSGETLGLRLAVNNLTRVIGPGLFGLVGSAFGLPPLFWLNSLLLATGAMLTRPEAADGGNARR